MVGHRWGDGALAVSGTSAGQIMHRCVRCGVAVKCKYGTKPPNIGWPILRHRFRVTFRHWTV